MTKDYVATRIGWKGLRPIWRLHKRGPGRQLTPLADYLGYPGRSGLKMIRETFRGFVTVHHNAHTRDQYAFRVIT